MSRHTIVQRTLVAAAAASVLAASPALARPSDSVDRSDSPTSSLAGTTSPRQDLRNEYSRDAARGVAPGPMPGQPTWPIDPEPIVKPKAAKAPDSGSDGNVWLFVASGLAASGVAAGAAAGVVRRNRLRARRVTA